MARTGGHSQRRRPVEPVEEEYEEYESEDEYESDGEYESDSEYESDDEGEYEADGGEVAGSGLSGRLAPLARWFNPPEPEGPPSPTRMSGREPLFGYIAAGVIVLASILNLVVTTGPGAPAHPTTWANYAGILFALALTVSIRFRNRMLSPFIAIFGAFFVTLAKGPDSLSLPHIVTLLVGVAFAMIVSLHQRRDQKALGPVTPAGRRAAADARARRRRGEPEPTVTKHPAPNRRYTPPKDRSKSTGR